MYLIKTKIDNGKYFSLSPDASCIILGHSHPECAFNDSLIDHFQNVAQSAESYFYTYLKLKKLLKNNPQVKTVLVEYTNNQLTLEMNRWTWGDKYLENQFPKYAAVMQSDDLKLLLQHNANSLFQSLSVAVKMNLFFLAGNCRNYIKYNTWGGYLYLEKQNKNFIKKEKEKIGVASNSSSPISWINIEYLQKIIHLCKINKVAIFLVRSPLNPLYEGTNNEMQYQQILHEKLAGTPLLDFKDFPLPSNAFGDVEHLNYRGAKIFSVYFNHLMSEGLLSQINKQQFIDTSMLLFARANNK